jgi:O-antigen/teichoic acid export membrane protein
LKELVKSVSKLSIPTLLNIIVAIIRTKILALIAGPIGVGIYSQFISISSLSNAILPVGSIGLTRYMSNYFSKNKTGEIAYLARFFFIRNFIIAILLTICFLIFAEKFSEIILTDLSLYNLFIIFSISIPISLFFNFVDIFFRSSRKITNYVIFQSFCALTNLIINVPLIFIWEITGAVVGIVLSTAINSLIGIIIIKKIKIFPNFNIVKKVESKVIKDIFWFGISSMVALIVMQMTLLIIKINLGDELGINAVGIFQSVYAISVNYFGIFFALLATYSIPKFSTFNTNKEYNDELNTTLKFLLIVYTPIIVFVYILRTLLIKVLYSDEFLLARELLFFQLLGDFFKAISWTFGLWLIPKLKIKQWLIFDIINYMVFYFTFYALLYSGKFGIKSVSIAYMISFILHVIINFAYVKISLNFSLSLANLKILSFSSLFVIFAFAISSYNEGIGYLVILPLLSIWLFLSIKKEELNLIKEIIYSKLKK